MKEYNNLYVCCRENGDKIEKIESIKEGREIIEGYELEDKQEGIYEEDFYAICEIDRDGKSVIETVE